MQTRTGTMESIDFRVRRVDREPRKEVTTEQRNRIEIDDVERSRFSAMYAYRYTSYNMNPIKHSQWTMPKYFRKALIHTRMSVYMYIVQLQLFSYLTRRAVSYQGYQAFSLTVRCVTTQSHPWSTADS